MKPSLQIVGALLLNPLSKAGLPESTAQKLSQWYGFNLQNLFRDTGSNAPFKERDFDNDIREYEELILSADTLNFTSNAKIKFRCNASGDGDDVYLDNVEISGR